MLYNIVLIDSRVGGETPPEIKTLDLSEDEFKEMEKMVEDFETTRYPYFYPQMYIYKIEPEKKEDAMDWIEERKDEVIRWQKRHEERQELLRKFRESKEENERVLILKKL